MPDSIAFEKIFSWFRQKCMLINLNTKYIFNASRTISYLRIFNNVYARKSDPVFTSFKNLHDCWDYQAYKNALISTSKNIKKNKFKAVTPKPAHTALRRSIRTHKPHILQKTLLFLLQLSKPPQRITHYNLSKLIS